MSNLPNCLMTADECVELWERARARRVLELGSWRGAGTVGLAHVAALVCSVDHHLGDAHLGAQDTLATYFWRVHAFGGGANIVSVVAPMELALPGLRRRWWELVVVDGAHDAASVTRDCAAASELVTLDGVIAVHDWGRWEVSQAAHDILGPPSKVVESLAVWMMG